MPKCNFDGMNLYYECSGVGEPIVLIAGLGIDHTVLNGLVKELSLHHQVLIFDNRGSGQSDKPTDVYSIEQMANDTVGLMQEVGINKASIIGISMGGKIAIQMAIAFPDRVEDLILISTSLSPTRISVISKVIKYVRSISSSVQQPYYAFNNQLMASRNYTGYSSIASISCRTLIMVGAKDKKVSASDIMEFQSKIQQCETIKFPQGHMFFLWNTKPVAKEIEIFLDHSSRRQ